MLVLSYLVFALWRYPLVHVKVRRANFLFVSLILDGSSCDNDRPNLDSSINVMKAKSGGNKIMFYMVNWKTKS